MPSLSWRLLLPIGAIEFVYIVDFVVLLPLGPDVARALEFDPRHLGWLASVYTLAATLAGLVSVAVLDRFPRKTCLLIALGGLMLCTLAAAMAPTLQAMLVARFLSGLCGGPALAASMALLLDNTLPEQRGRAISKVALGSSLAFIGGVPAALEIARWSHWNMVFLLLAALILLVWLLAAWQLPAHAAVSPPSAPHSPPGNPLTMLGQRDVQLACLIQSCGFFSAFLIIPVFSAFYLLNLDFPREYLGLLYLAGGICTIPTMQIAGSMSDKYGALPVTAVALLLFGLGLAPFMMGQAAPAVLCFLIFMSANTMRNVSLSTRTSQVPPPHQRAGFMALQGVAQDAGIGLASLAGSLFLYTGADGSFQGSLLLAIAAIGAGVIPLILLRRLDKMKAVAE